MLLVMLSQMREIGELEGAYQAAMADVEQLGWYRSFVRLLALRSATNNSYEINRIRRKS